MTDYDELKGIITSGFQSINTKMDVINNKVNSLSSQIQEVQAGIDISKNELPDQLEYLLSLDIVGPFLEKGANLPKKLPTLPCVRMPVPEDEELWRRELPVDPEARAARLEELLSIDIDAEMAPFLEKMYGSPEESSYPPMRPNVSTRK